jgi:hypothetical protein
MKKILLLIIAIGGAGLAYYQSQAPQTYTSADRPAQVVQQWQSGEQVSGGGTVLRLLSDDNSGDRHQRFILKMISGQTLLIAHNIDLAPRIQSLKEGDFVMFFGQYETNSQGGVVHWTHRDPQGRHIAGWLEHNGKRYQ